MRKTRAVLGDWNMTCQRTGRVFKRSEMKQEWTGLWVHKSVWEPRHPQDIITPKDDQTSVYPATPEAPLVFDQYTPATMPESNLDEY